MSMNLRFFACLLAVSAFARQDAANRITLDVVANDKSGQPVAGLTQQDFSVFAGKEMQPILSFEAKSDPSGGEMVIVLDAINTTYERLAFARQQLQKFLQQDAGKLAQPVSIAFLTDKGLNMRENPTQDGNELADEVNKNVSGLRTIGRSQGFYGAADRLNLSLRALNQLVELESKREGRKIIVWVSPGWPLLSGPRMQLSTKEEKQIFDTVTSLSTQLRQARITLYVADPLGTEQGLLSENYYRNFVKGIRKEQEAQYGDLSLQVFAIQSGGRVLNANNDIASEMERCVRDLKNYYVLSFAALPAEKPNEYHAIEVKIDKPDIKAQTRIGYYAQPR